jgi:hypothetical protein
MVVRAMLRTSVLIASRAMCLLMDSAYLAMKIVKNAMEPLMTIVLYATPGMLQLLENVLVVIRVVQLALDQRKINVLHAIATLLCPQELATVRVER